MKSKTSFFNAAAFRKDMTRFAPAWLLYLVFLCLGLLLTAEGQLTSLPERIARMVPGMAVVNMLYALAVVQLLMGDLYNSRMCNALHALPLRREGWFAVHTVSGILFSLLPNLAVTLLSLALLGDSMAVALWWLLAAQLQYLFFFGLAVLCAMLVGSRFAQAVVYGLLNAAAPLIHLVGIILYQPLLYGIQFSGNWVSRFCPVMEMAGQSEYIKVDISLQTQKVESLQMGQGWGYLAVCGGIGAVLVLVAVVLYRRRNLECAGDFMAFKALNPVFLLVYTLAVGIVLQSFGSLFLGREKNGYIFLLVGVVVGFFTGRMLLRRQVNVFGRREFAQLALILAVLFGSFYVTRLDPTGITRWIPAAEEVEQVVLSDGGMERWNSFAVISDPKEIRDILELHQREIQTREGTHSDAPNSQNRRQFGLHYTLRNGKRVERFYVISTSDPQWEKLERIHSSVEYVLKMPADQVRQGIQSITFYNGEYSLDTFSEEDMHDLLEAIILDCQEGTMSQQEYHYQRADTLGALDISLKNPEGYYLYSNVDCFTDSMHTVTWLKDNLSKMEETAADTQNNP